MSKLLLVVDRKGNDRINTFNKYVTTVADRIIPANIKPNDTMVLSDEGLACYVFNPVQSLYVKNRSVCLGYMLNYQENWWLPRTKLPDGTYALFRTNSDYIEVISDILASRTIFYYYDVDVFVASTSQRAIIMYLRSFEFNDKTIPWMLFSGITGPDFSWDKRIKLIPGNTTLMLNRNTWEIKITAKPCIFEHHAESYETYQQQLIEILTDLLQHDEIDYNKWALTLSGGYDSRGLLLFLKDKPGLKTITWGLENSANEKNNDAYIAQAVANYYQIQHSYFATDRSTEDFDTVFQRFLIAGEGRIDHIGGYMDGFKLWSILFNNQITGIIRGDHTFGWSKVFSAEDVYNSLSIKRIYSFSNQEVLGKLDVPGQEIPEYFSRIPGESLSVMRDRLYSVFRVPCILAALNDIKLPYVEVYNPLMTTRVNLFIRTLPDELRTGKKLLKDLINTLSSEIPYTKQEAILTHDRVVQEPNIAIFLKNELNRIPAHSILPPGILSIITGKIELDQTQLKKRSARILYYQKIRGTLPGWSKSFIRKRIPKQQLDFNLLAFRALIIHRMHVLLNDDATVLSNK